MFATVDLFNTNLERPSAWLMVQDILYLAHRKIRKNFHKKNFPITFPNWPRGKERTNMNVLKMRYCYIQVEQTGKRLVKGGRVCWWGELGGCQYR